MVVERTGWYLLFANYHDATHDPVPKRVVPNPFGDHFAPRLVMDEAEWLARPDLWGTELISDRKRNLAECHSLRWAADVGLKCPACRPLLHLLATEHGFDTAVVDTLDWLKGPAAATPAAFAGCVCGSRGVVSACRRWVRGMYSDMGFINTTIDRLYDGTRPSLPADAKPEQVEAHHCFNRESWEYGRTLALDLCGPNPFRPIAFDPRWRSESAVALARTAYDTRNFTLLPILADALEEAGCDNADVLTHCREPNGVHVRGCWVVDGVLGKV